MKTINIKQLRARKITDYLFQQGLLGLPEEWLEYSSKYQFFMLGLELYFLWLEILNALKIIKIDRL